MPRQLSHGPSAMVPVTSSHRMLRRPVLYLYSASPCRISVGRSATRAIGLLNRSSSTSFRNLDVPRARDDNVMSGTLVIFRIGSIGDTVVALPCFHAIARAFPGHRKVLLTNAVASARASSVETVLEGTGLIDAALYFPVGRGKLNHS